MKIVWLGHAAFIIYCGEKKILIDPYISGSFPKDYEQEIQSPDYILVTHGHGDHLGDTLRLYDRSRTKVVSNVEICNWLRTKDVTNCAGLNIGGSFTENDIQFSMVQAIHSSSITEGDKSIYGGLAAGFIIRYNGRSVYHFGDTDIFSDMGLIQQLYSPDIGLIPVGGTYTMSPRTAAIACNRFFNFRMIIPMHYSTFPAIDVDINDFANSVNKKDTVCCLKPGEYVEI